MYTLFTDGPLGDEFSRVLSVYKGTAKPSPVYVNGGSVEAWCLVSQVWSVDGMELPRFYDKGSIFSELFSRLHAKMSHV